MNLMVIGASRGLGRAFIEGLAVAGDTVVGVSRVRPIDLAPRTGIALQWIEADLSHPHTAVPHIEQHSPAMLDVLIHNLGIWEETAFSDAYAFLADPDASIDTLVSTNVLASLLLLKRLLPRLLRSARPRLILTGSTSALRHNGRPEVAFGASKSALVGMADALREGFRAQHLGVTLLQLGYLNTEDALAVPVSEAAARGAGQQVPVHDVVQMVQALLQLSDASFVKELVMPAILDARF